jgi:hypothetical protein
VKLECNYTLRASRLRELKVNESTMKADSVDGFALLTHSTTSTQALHSAVLLAALDLLRAQGVALVAPPDL